ncbi:MAG: T9SS type A sorting domain-containing protein [Bacteroidia bacterium]|nr:T9SS type A sorting domain-containing protein [Bacteroidia bacterium]
MKFICGFLALFIASAQAQTVYPLMPNIEVDSILAVKPGATKIAYDALSNHLYYSTVDGNIYRVNMLGTGAATDTLMYTASNHGITFLQGLFFKDSTLFVCGNNWGAVMTIGMVVKGVLQPNGMRQWINVVTTDPYPMASISGDHGFSAVHVDPTGNYIFVSSGARTHLGEVRTFFGSCPNCREIPITSKIFRFPVQSVGLTLPNDSTALSNSGYLFASGTRNAYAMAWDANQNLFAIDNSGERDDPEELNWIRQGHHYGFPWRMGGNDNPLRFPPYDVNQDALVNPLCAGYINGWFANDTTFPPVPQGVTFTDPIRNYGVDADYFRTPTGQVNNASDMGSYITTFTAHRSPLGLVTDADSVLPAPYTGLAFVLNFMPGGDSSGYTPISPWGGPGPFVDTARGLLAMQLNYNAAIDNFELTAQNIVDGFYLPVDATLVGNKLYAIENGGDIWQITFTTTVGMADVNFKSKVYPNPFNQHTNILFNNDGRPATLTVYNSVMQVVQTIHSTTNQIQVERNNLPAGIYFFILKTQGYTTHGKLVVD